MKDTTRPHPTPSSRSVPYRKRKPSGNASPTRGTRRTYDASQTQPGTREVTSPSDRANNSRGSEAQTPRAALGSVADGERRALSKTGGDHAIFRARRHTSPGGPARDRPSHTSALSTHADVPGPSLRLPLASAPSTINAFTGHNKTESPPPGSVTAFLRSIELPVKPSSAPPLQKPFSLSTPPSHRLPPLSTGNTNKTNGNGHQVSLVYKGYPFTYDLSALPDDPKGTITLLNITKSDPGAYILVSAHYRRTGRSRAACVVIRSLLDNLDTPSNVDKAKGDAVPIPTSATSTVTLVSPGSPCLKAIDCTRPVVKSASMRPAMLLLAACEMDISRERPDDPERAGHANTAHDLFRAVYGTVNDAIIAGAMRPQPKNALGLEFSSNRNCSSSSSSDSNGHPPSSALPPPPPAGAASSTRVKELEKELSVERVTQKKLQEKLTVSNDRLTWAEDKVHTLESRSREMRVQLDASRDENWELRQRLTESEQRARDLAQCAPSAENRVWGRLKDLLFDNLGGVRGV
ncbi:hypothetical protein JVT61DRAFT_13956 [Boletus reticuloceps]|uniref:Uncharacterized protein n=1 Tax=Boletus reticuloceps TaxID=495285 RepID=A0A8I2YTG8_9AGAM|nr:hypothetical protein JVT61DRAFT_13956 [Boletus reticuloceps]